MILNRITRVGLPLLIFGTITALLIPLLWIYGWTGSFDLQSFQNTAAKGLDLKSSGGVIAHLWFLYYLSLLYSVIAVARFFWSVKSSLILIFLFWCIFIGVLIYTYGAGPLEGIGIFRAITPLIISGAAAVIVTVAVLQQA